MDTNQVINRDDVFIQRTKDLYFNATALINYWNANNPEKQLARYKVNDSTKEFIELLKKEGIERPFISGRGKGKNSGTWMHPKLFIDFAMWVSVEFKSKVIDYVFDGLIKSRNDAGDYYKEMGVAILEEYINVKGTKPSPFIYIKEANMLREISGINKERNELTEKELNLLTALQKFNTTFIRKHIGPESRKKNLRLVVESLKL